MLPEVVAEAARRFGDLPAFVTPDGTATSFAELHARSQAVAAGLRQMGIGEGDVVVLRLPSEVPYVTAYIGAATVGAITAGINPRLAEPEQAALVDLAGTRRVFATSDEVLDLEHLHVGAEVEPVSPDPDRDVAIVFTSGTTGLPKGAVFTNAQLDAITAIDVQHRWGGGGPMLASTQFAHVGFMTKLPWYLRLGTRMHLIDRWRAGDVLRLIAEQRMAAVGAVAPQVALMLQAPEMDELDLSCVQLIIAGAGASPPALVAEAKRRFGAAYSIRYSSTECGGCGTGTAPDAPDDEALFTVGRPRPGIEVRICDPDGAELPPGEVGEVCLRSGAVMDRYWNDPEATADALRDGWLWSGDLGLIDDAGCLRLAGRRKEMFVRGGYNVYPMEVEAALGQVAGVAQCAVVARPDPTMGEIGVAVVVPSDPSVPPTLEDIRAALDGRIARYKIPEAVRVVEEIPLTAMQKIDRRALEAAELA